MNLANITRLHNITASIAAMRKMIALLTDYSEKRKVFKNYLKDQELHVISLTNMKMELEGSFLLFFQMIKMFSKMELNEKYKNRDLVRLLLPVAKYFTARNAELVCLEGIQGFGGVGYMENSGIPIILRDVIVTSIWEGSINLLAFDFNKVLLSNTEAYKKLLTKISRKITSL
jgi:acyl-CoA dehydrogenase